MLPFFISPACWTARAQPSLPALTSRTAEPARALLAALGVEHQLLDNVPFSCVRPGESLVVEPDEAALRRAGEGDAVLPIVDSLDGQLAQRRLRRGGLRLLSCSDGEEKDGNSVDVASWRGNLSDRKVRQHREGFVLRFLLEVRNLPTATVTSKGQITLPKAVRDLLQVDTGSQVDFVVTERGDVVVRAVSVDLADLKGLLRRPRRLAVSIEAMNAAIQRQHARKR